MLRSPPMLQNEMPEGQTSRDPLGQIKSRPLRHLISWWCDKRGEYLMPLLSDIDPAELRPALSQIWLCDYVPQSDRFRYRLAGEEINNFWGLSLRGKYLDEIVPAQRLATITSQCHMALDLPAIVYVRGCLSLSQEIERHCERIVLPLSEDGKTVSALLGATHRDWFLDLELDPYIAYSETTAVAALNADAATDVENNCTAGGRL